MDEFRSNAFLLSPSRIKTSSFDFSQSSLSKTFAALNSEKEFLNKLPPLEISERGYIINGEKCFEFEALLGLL